jgi:amino acid transporter
MRSGRLVRFTTGVGTAVLMLSVHATVAFAQPYPGGGQHPPVVKGKTFFRGGGTNADTGLNILLWIVLAVLCLCLGFILYRLSRRSSAGSVE